MKPVAFNYAEYIALKTENERLTADLIESLQADHESYQQVKKALQREGYSDIETMISQYKQVMIAAKEEIEYRRAQPENKPLTEGGSDEAK